jgi:hypothetical protein
MPLHHDLDKLSKDIAEQRKRIEQSLSDSSTWRSRTEEVTAKLKELGDRMGRAPLKP